MKHRFHLFRALAAGSAILAAGCGFQPLYGAGGSAGLPWLQIEAGDSRQDYLLGAALDRFLGAGRSDYRIALRTSANERRLGVSAAGRASRYAYRLTTAYTLSDREGEVATGRVSETVYFDAPSDPYALIAARANAEERAADLLARTLTRDIARSLERTAAGDAP